MRKTTSARRRTPIFIAHRGASAVAPESTRAAIRAAAAAGAQMVELDVQMTRDIRLVIFHDDRLERTTNGSGRLAQARYPQLARLDAGSWFHPRFTGERILLVAEAVGCIPKPMRMNLELKRTTKRRVLLRRFVRLVDRLGIRNRLLVSSFDRALLRPLRRFEIDSALLSRRDADRSLQDAIYLGCAAWHPFVSLVTPGRIRAAHAAGLKVHVWIVDDVASARRLARWGVDGVFTNDPARLKKALRQTYRQRS